MEKTHKSQHLKVPCQNKLLYRIVEIWTKLRCAFLALYHKHSFLCFVIIFWVNCFCSHCSCELQICACTNGICGPAIRKKQIKIGPQFSKLALWLFFFNKSLNIVFNHRNQISRKLSSYSCKSRMEFLSHSTAWEKVCFMFTGGSYFRM